jgi:hypothetical protein
MDFKKLIAGLAARYRKLTEPISSSSLAPPGQVVDVDAAHENGRNAGYEAGYKKGYDEGLQLGLEAKTLPEPSGPESQIARESFGSRGVGRLACQHGMFDGHKGAGAAAGRID